MKSKTQYLFGILALMTGVGMNIVGCSSTEMVSTPPPIPPAYTSVPHPLTHDTSDLSQLFREANNPKINEMIKNCDGDYLKLNALTQSKDELHQGLLELVKQDPVNYHWCFYGKLLELENTLSGEAFLDEKQKKVISTYQFLVPVAQAFVSLFHDTRYLRVAIDRYKKTSSFVFFRKLEVTSMGASELVEIEKPFGLWRDEKSAFTVLEKYHLGHPSTPPLAEPSAAPSLEK